MEIQNKFAQKAAEMSQPGPPKEQREAKEQQENKVQDKKFR